MQDLKTIHAPNLRLHLPQARLSAASWTGRARCWSRAVNWNSTLVIVQDPAPNLVVLLAGEITGRELGGQSVTLEPGGKFEL